MTHADEDNTREQVLLAARKRLESFQFRRATTKTSPPPSTITPTPKSYPHHHSRSHSRNSSIVSLSHCTSSSSATSEMSSSSSRNSVSDSWQPNAGSRSRPTSHHRRRSSVSTRVESAELMGVSLPELPPSSSDDNMIFGDRDSIRRRALWALEGKSSLDTSNTATVEIPQLPSPASESKPFEYPVKPAPNPAPFGLGSSFSGKRDSKLLATSSLKDQLHTLLEEEEEDDNDGGAPSFGINHPLLEHPNMVADSLCYEEPDFDADTTMTADSSDSSIMTSPLTSSRHRPANLVLRPLALTSPSQSSCGLPTPSLTPNSRVPGLKNLTLADGPLTATPSSEAQKRPSPSQVHTPSPSPVPSTAVVPTRRRATCSSASPLKRTVDTPKRRSSLSYIRSSSSPSPTPTNMNPAFSLPTPGGTPTADRRSSISSVSDTDSLASRERPLSSCDQFYYHSHASLLSRITDLERALHTRSRTSSIHSDFSIANSEPTDEMFQLVTDLKNERDELKRNMEVWEEKVAELERAKGILERRIENERREGWMKAETVTKLEIEKNKLAKMIEEREEEVDAFRYSVREMQDQLSKAVEEKEEVTRGIEVVRTELRYAEERLQRMDGLEAELLVLRKALSEERARREEAEAQLESAGLMNTPISRGVCAGAGASACSNTLPKYPRTLVRSEARKGSGLGFESIDSQRTIDGEDVYSPESSLKGLKGAMMLKAVEEVPEDYDGGMMDEEDELSRYEDDDGCYDDSMSASSSFDGDDDFIPRSTEHLKIAFSGSSSSSGSNTPSPSPCPTPVASTSPLPTPEVFGSGISSIRQHRKSASLSKTWSFPRGEPPMPALARHEVVDRFFGCLEDLDEDPTSSPERNTKRSSKRLGDKSAFSRVLQFSDDDEEDELPPFVIPVQQSLSMTSSLSSRMSLVLDVVMEEDEDEEYQEEIEPDLDSFQGEEVEGGVKFTFGPPFPQSVRGSDSSGGEFSPSFSESFDSSRSGSVTGPMCFTVMERESISSPPPAKAMESPLPPTKVPIPSGIPTSPTSPLRSFSFLVNRPSIAATVSLAQLSHAKIVPAPAPPKQVDQASGVPRSVPVATPSPRPSSTTSTSTPPQTSHSQHSTPIPSRVSPPSRLPPPSPPKFSAAPNKAASNGPRRSSAPPPTFKLAPKSTSNAGHAAKPRDVTNTQTPARKTVAFPSNATSPSPQRERASNGFLDELVNNDYYQFRSERKGIQDQESGPRSSATCMKTMSEVRAPRQNMQTQYQNRDEDDDALSGTLRAFTNFIPMSMFPIPWKNSSSSKSTCVAEGERKEPGAGVVCKTEGRKLGYVSKERQLEKLRAQMSEGRGLWLEQVVCCGRCEGGVIEI